MPFSSQCIKGACYQRDLSVDVDSGELPDVVYVRFLHSKVTLFPAFHTVLFGRSHYAQTTLNEKAAVHSLFEGRVSQKLFGILCRGFPPPPNLFIYLVIYFYQY